MVISNTELEVLRECRYSKYDIGMVSDRAYLSIVMTNDCNKNCFYCINGNTDRSLQLPVDKAIENIRAVVDLEDYVNSTGTFNLTPKIYVDGFPDVGEVGEVPQISIALKEAEETT